jgi:glycosyltransferase involved in cell wall biosynthesis
MRIALATPTQHDACETFIANHIERLDSVELVLTGGSLPGFDRAGRPFLAATPFAMLIDRARSSLLGQDWRTRLRKDITLRLRRERIQVVLAEYGTTASEMLPCCQAAGVPLVAYFLGFDAYRHDMLERYGDYRALFAHAAALVGVSRAICDQLIALGAPPEKVHYNSCGADLGLFTRCSPGTAPPHFLAVGRFVDKKAPHLTLLAFARAYAQRPDARLTMVGDGPLWETCHQLVRALGLQERVDLCGRRAPAEVSALLQRSRAFVQHSVITSTNDREGTPVAILESMAAGVPVISTRHGDITELVKHEERGLLCDEGDVEAMAAGMLRLIDHPAEAARMGDAAAAYVKAEHRLEDRIAALQSILARAASRA